MEEERQYQPVQQQYNPGPPYNPGPNRFTFFAGVIMPALSITGGADAASGSGVIATGLNAAGTWLRSHSCWRQRNNWLTWIPAALATSDVTAPGSRAAATIRSFSARDQLRRRCTDVITSTCVLVIEVVLGLLLGLAIIAQPGKAAFTGSVRCCQL